MSRRSLADNLVGVVRNNLILPSALSVVAVTFFISIRSGNRREEQAVRLIQMQSSMLSQFVLSADTSSLQKAIESLRAATEWKSVRVSLPGGEILAQSPSNHEPKNDDCPMSLPLVISGMDKIIAQVCWESSRLRWYQEVFGVFVPWIFFYGLLSFALFGRIRSRIFLFVSRLRHIVSADHRESAQLGELSIEEDMICVAMKDRVETIVANELLKSEIQRANSVESVARQVAHDIRSPLAALDMILKSLKEVPEDKRVLVRSAIGRIRDIANNLVAKASQQSSITIEPTKLDEGAESTSIELLPVLIEGLVSEKRLQFRSKLGVTIDSNLGPSSYGLFSRIAPSQFKRVLSNLVNNAVEAMPDEKGSVAVNIDLNDHHVLIEIVDDGKGIAPELLPKLGEKGASFGKVDHEESGSGLGLYHAKKMIREWGGRMEITSTVGRGTTIRILLPQAETPRWFVSELRLTSATTVVVLDDDQSIHGIWQGRFESLRARIPALELLHFSTPEDLASWVRSLNPTQVLYLFDYELIGHRQTGLDLIESLGIEKNAILVTSRFEERHVRERCDRLGVKLIPKPMAAFVPMRIESQELAGELISGSAIQSGSQSASRSTSLVACDVVLIDDDPLVHMTWQLAASERNKKIVVFADEASFLARAREFSLSTPIYIDQNLADGVKGLDMASRLAANGFTRIYIATGDDPSSLSLPSGLNALKGVVGKDPPF